jgi:hypothetical protein
MASVFVPMLPAFVGVHNRHVSLHALRRPRHRRTGAVGFSDAPRRWVGPVAKAAQAAE